MHLLHLLTRVHYNDPSSAQCRRANTTSHCANRVALGSHTPCTWHSFTVHCPATAFNFVVMEPSWKVYKCNLDRPQDTWSAKAAVNHNRMHTVVDLPTIRDVCWKKYASTSYTTASMATSISKPIWVSVAPETTDMPDIQLKIMMPYHHAVTNLIVFCNSICFWQHYFARCCSRYRWNRCYTLCRAAIVC